MRLLLSEAPAGPAHGELCTGVSWLRTAAGAFECTSCGDDRSLQRTVAGEASAEWCSVDARAACLHWLQAPPGSNGTDMLAVGCSNGALKLVSPAARVEKSVDAHKGSVIAVKWSPDGSALATGGEDGTAKMWSRNAMPRSTLAQLGHPVYCLAWSKDADQLLLGTHTKVVIKASQAGGQAAVEWKAHQGVVLCVDWAPVTDRIVTGGEDRMYKIWDPLGRLLFQSTVHQQVVTSVAWAPRGTALAVGSHELVKLCDGMGWSHSRQALPREGSALTMAWTDDGTRVAVGMGSGMVHMGTVVDRTLQWQALTATVAENGSTVVVTDASTELTEELDQRERVVDLALGHGLLVVTSATHLSAYAAGNWLTPHVADLHLPVSLIKIAPAHFAVVDANGVRVHAHDGRMVTSIKLATSRTDLMHADALALSRDALAFVDPANAKQVRIFSLTSGKPLRDPVVLKQDAVRLGMNCSAASGQGLLTILDASGELHVTPVHRADAPQRLAVTVASFLWHEAADVLAVYGDSKLRMYLYPAAAMLDRDLLPLTVQTTEASDLGQLAQLDAFTGQQLAIRKPDGSRVYRALGAAPLLLHAHLSKGMWDKAVRLCRYVKQPAMWATLACMAIQARELGSAEIALAAIDEVDKVHFLAHIAKQADEVLQQAELALFCKRPDEALQLLLANGRIYRAIKLNMRLHRWEVALDLAVQQKTHIDTVLCYRAEHLAAMRHSENNEKFLRLAQEVHFDKAAVAQKIAAEKERERTNAGVEEG